jgi:DNA-binding transcriptional MerR regulator
MIDKSPDAFRTISEAAEHLDLPQHVLRFWETRFPQIKPLKRGGGRRYYRPDDVDFLRGLKHLLHAERYTIKGVQKIIKEQGQKAVQAAGNSASFAQPAGNSASFAQPAGNSKAVASQTDNGVAVAPRAAKDQPTSAPMIAPAPTIAPIATKPVMRTAPIAPTATPVIMPSSMRGKLDAALAEMLECRRILAQLNAA